MVMKNIGIIIFGLLTSLSLTECKRTIDNDANHEKVNEHKVTIEKSANEIIDKPFANPVLIYGSSFGNYLQSLYRIGEFNDMLRFTSSQTIEKYGKDRILQFYQKEFTFGFELGKLTSKNESNKIITLNYSNSVVNATKTTIRMQVIVENDTCKILLPSLKPNPFIN